jgi:hypothetical protein
MNEEREVLTAVRESLSGAHLGTTLEATIRRGQKLRARRRIAGLGAAAVIAGSIALPASGLADGGHSPHPQQAQLAAWTVTKSPHGYIVVRVSQLSDPSGLQRTLRADGVPAAVAFQRGMIRLTPPLPRQCNNTGLSPQADAAVQQKIMGPKLRSFTPDGHRSVALTMRPAQIPKGIGLNLTVHSSTRSWGWSLGLVRATPECTG